jgi:hypothetical protein
VKTLPVVKVCPATETGDIVAGAEPSMMKPADASEMTCPSIVINPPGVNVCPPIDICDAELSVNVELPRTSKSGPDVVENPVAINIYPAIRREDISLTVVGFWARESPKKESMRTRNCMSFRYIMRAHEENVGLETTKNFRVRVFKERKALSLKGRFHHAGD